MERIYMAVLCSRDGAVVLNIMVVCMLDLIWLVE